MAGPVDTKPSKVYKKRKGWQKILLGDPSTNKNIQAADKFYQKNIKNKSLTARLKNVWKQLSN